ncbi:MAG: iron-containing alcohol dehydrogenase [Clostridia bacterium]|nr:iron-containing alcohol dehydrogenase [Clostridia bacterium]
MDFSTYKPVAIYTGEGCLSLHPEIFSACGRRAFIVSGAHGADACGAFDDVADTLGKAGCTYVRWTGVKENPPASDCREAAQIAVREGCDFIVAIGGGSALDAGKAVAGYAANPTIAADEIYDETKRTAPCLPIIAVPTTAGTGSEACRYSVLTIDGGRRKKTFKDVSAYPRASFVDPRYTATLSDRYTVSTALDALAHAMESFFSPKTTPSSAEAALYAAREIWDVLFRQRTRTGWTTADRERLAYAATAAGIAIDTTGTGFPHPLGYCLTLSRGTPHGEACAIFEGAFLTYNMLTAEGRIRAGRLADALGTTPEEMIRQIPEASGISLTIPADERETLIDRVAGAGNFANSPYVISRGEMSDIFARLFG